MCDLEPPTEHPKLVKIALGQRAHGEISKTHAEAGSGWIGTFVRSKAVGIAPTVGHTTSAVALRHAARRPVRGAAPVS